MKKKEVDKVLETITIIVDTREKQNIHVLNYFANNNISFVKEKLDFGDYSFMIPKNEALGITEDVRYKERIAIERKSGLKEISGNFTKGRERFRREFERAKEKGCNIRIVIEDDTYSDIDKGKYSKMNTNAMKKSIHSFDIDYDLPVIFIEKEYVGDYIYNRFYTWLKKKLENNKII